MISLSLVVCACATKIGDSTPTTFTGLDPERLINDLSITERGRLCLDVASFKLTVLDDEQWTRGACALSSVGADDCPTALDRCARITIPRGPDPDVSACDAFVSDAASCFMSVHDYAACVIDLARWAARIGSNASAVCATGVPEQPRCPGFSRLTTSSAACTRLAPAFFP